MGEVTTTLQLCLYYASLLIIQYIGKSKAFNTIRETVTPLLMPQTSVQLLTFSAVPTSGSYVLSYGDVSTSSLSWNSNAGAVQTALRAITGLSAITVTGDTTDGFEVTFTGVLPIADLIEVVSSSLMASSVTVSITITDTDVILPLAVQDGFNLSGDNIAVGAQLDVIGQYVGVTRSGQGFSSYVTLSDSDFLVLIKIGIARNNIGSSLYDIQQYLATFFAAGTIYVYDYQTMKMSYMISSTLGSSDLIQLIVAQNLLPRPMAVQISSIIYFPVINTFFGFRTYSLPAFNSSPFNTYSDYQTDYPWLSYAYAVNS